MQNSAITPENARSKLTVLSLWLPILAMTIVIVASNVAVMVPINDWLTWGAFTYPFVFLVTDLTNRAVGPQGARKVAWVGLVFAVVLSV
nr:VUT family protein [Betaproteobacteria bacterium]